MLHYPIVIHKDATSDYGVTVPDLPGCFSAGKTLDDAMSNAREAIELHLEGLMEDGGRPPAPGDLERHQRNADFRGGAWAIVSVDPAELRTRAVRVNVTMPERALERLDRFAREKGDTRSGTILNAIAAYMGDEADPALRRAKPGRRFSRAAKSGRGAKSPRTSRAARNRGA